jgi:peptidyl-prolyl cis-trans isomerase D
MLQQIRDSVGRWLAGAILFLIALGFIFWGINFEFGAQSYAAKVNGEEISLTAFDRELQAQQSQFQQLYHTDLTPELRRQIRQNVIERLIRNTALKQRVHAEGYRVSDQRVTAAIRAMSAFQIGGEFSMDLYRGQLRNQGITPSGFEAMEREQLEVLELQNGLTNSSFMTPAEFRRYIELYNEQRELGYARFTVDGFLDRTQVDDSEISSYYDENKQLYKSEETVDLEYIELKRADLLSQIDVTDSQLQAYYEQEKDRFQVPEERHARHILIASSGDDAADEAKAEAVLARIKGGEDFATVAAEVSDDAGTKDKGGDLGWITRGMLEGPFEDALFAMSPGEVRGPVKTQYGYHIIRLDGIHPAQQRSFEEVRDELRTEYRDRHVDDLFYQQANALEDAAFDAYDELATVADQMNLPLQKVSGFPRSGDTSVFENSAAVVQAAFSPEVLEQGANSSLIQLSDDDVMVLRVTGHHPAEQLPLEAVRDQIKDELARNKAAELASKSADEFLSKLSQSTGEADISQLADAEGGTWTEPSWVGRGEAKVPTEILATAFRLAKPSGDMSVRERVPLASGDQAVLVVSGVRYGKPEAVSADQRDQRLHQLAQQSAMFDMAAYAEAVRNQARVSISDQVTNPPSF